MDEQPNLECGKTLGTIIDVKKSFHSLNFDGVIGMLPGETNLCTIHQLHNKLWKPTLASRGAQKNGRTGPELCSFPVLPFFWGSPRSLGCSQWVGCPEEGTGITHV
ncbi:hypothetical protein TNCV_722351 [Trichonephila clavipes]|nr:hypothetical protein TNCV_722351 [Trichonephila clavipes]